MSEASQAPTGMLSIRLKTLAAELPAIDIPANATVNELKCRIRNDHPFMQSVSKRLRLAHHVEGEQRIELSDESKSLESCGVTDGSDLMLTVETLPEITKEETKSLLSCDTTKAIEILAQRAGTLDLRGFCRVDAFCSRKYYDMQVSSPLSIALAYNNTITSLNVETYPYRSEDVDLLIGLSHDKGVNCIADMLLQNKSIQSLLLSGQVRISEKITDRLVKAARQNGNITELGIAGFLTNSSVLAELLAPEAKFVKLEFDVNSHADELSRLIANNTTVTSLKLSLTCGLGRFGSLEHESLPVLSEMFAQNSNIRTLSIAHSELNSKSMDFLADAFKRNTSITALDLQNNQADYSDSSSNAGIPRLLAENPRLIKLNLRANQLRDDVLTSIAVSLTNNSVLQELNLRKTSMSAKGALEIAKMLESNTSITDINLSENQVGTEGLLSILNSLEHNSTITHIDLMRIGVTRTPEQEEACIAMCQSRGVEMKFKENRIPESCASSFNIRCDDNRYRLYGF